MYNLYQAKSPVCQASPKCSSLSDFIKLVVQVKSMFVICVLYDTCFPVKLLNYIYLWNLYIYWKINISKMYRKFMWAIVLPVEVWKLFARCNVDVYVSVKRLTLCQRWWYINRAMGFRLMFHMNIPVTIDAMLNIDGNIWVFPKCFSEFSDKNICHNSRRAQTATLPPLVLETRMVPQHQQDTC